MTENGRRDLRFALPLLLAGCTGTLPLRGAGPPDHQPPSFIAVDSDRVTALMEADTERAFVPVGVNYFGPHMGWAPKLWQRFDAVVVRTHLKLIRQQGFNTIRVFLTLDAFHRQPGEVSDEGLAKFRQLLGICRELGMRVIPSGPDHWEGIPAWLRGKDPFADELVLRANEQWWESFTARFRDEPTVLAWDLLNEPSIRWHSPVMQEKWNAWLQAKYGTIEALTAAHHIPDGQNGRFGEILIPDPQPPRDDLKLYDYQLFRESVADQWTSRLVAAVRRGSPKHLVTIGHIQWAGTSYLPTVKHYSAFNLQENAKHVDFVTIHFYPIVPPKPCDDPTGVDRNADYLESLLRECSVGKPVMIGEFAWYGGGDIRNGERVVLPVQTLDDQLEWNERLLEVSRGRVCGWLHWAFADTPTSRDLTRRSGLWTEDLRPKPWGEVFGQFARQIVRDPATRRPFDQPATQRTRRQALTAPDPRGTF